MNHEEKFITDLNEAKIFGFEFTKEIFRSQLNKPKLISNLPMIIDFSFQNKINIIPLLSQIAQELHSNKFNISTECVATICKKLKENIKNISIDDNAIIEICTIKTNHSGIDSSYIKPQLERNCERIPQPRIVAGCGSSERIN